MKFLIRPPDTTDFRSVGLLISTVMYGSAHTTEIRNRPTNKFDGYYRPTANQYGALSSADRWVRSELWKGIVTRFFVMAFSNVARRNVNCRKKRHLLKTFKSVLVRERSADCLSGMCAHSPPTRLFSWPSVRASSPTRSKIGRLKNVETAKLIDIFL
jgi:hypothetical protein